MFATADPVSRFGEVAIRILAVGGGFVLGWVVATILLKLFFVPKKTESGQGVRKGIKTLCGVIGAIIIAGILFSHGSGWSFFGNSSGKDGSGTPATTTAETSTNTTPKPATPSVAPSSKLVITVLGGEDVKEEKFYLLGEDPLPKTFAEFVVAARAKKDTATDKRITLEIQFARRNTLPADHPAVVRLVRWAREAGVDVSFPAVNP